MFNDRDAKTISRNRLKPIAVGVAGILGLASPTAFANVFVSNCEDSGPGSLRNAVASAPTSEIVDATALAGVCSKITLKTGAINVSQDDLYIVGPGMDSLSIAGEYDDKYQTASRIFTHTGKGFLALYNMTMTDGYAGDPVAKGGCIYSKGGVLLRDVAVTRCEARSSSGVAKGGGIYAVELGMTRSSLTYSRAEGGSGLYAAAYGGGASISAFFAYYSSVVGNVSTTATGLVGQYGGLDVHGGSVYLTNSTIALNKASGNVGGLSFVAGNVRIANSTISSNSARLNVGGIFLQPTKLQILNSTISNNTAGQSDSVFPPGLSVKRYYADYAKFEMQSTIVANNSYGSSPAKKSDLSSDIAVTGSNNLVEVSNASLPYDTIVGKCAFLGKLKDNGGLTLTQALLNQSPAIDKGNNTFGARFDQRGRMSSNGEQNYPRESGPPATPARADIGAYEIDRADEIYDAEFDSC